MEDPHGGEMQCVVSSESLYYDLTKEEDDQK